MTMQDITTVNDVLDELNWSGRVPEPEQGQPEAASLENLREQMRDLEQRLQNSQIIRSELVREKTQLEVQVDQARRETAEKAQELTDFRKQVVDVAMEAAIEKDWCSEIEELLEDGLGLTVPPSEATVEVTVTFKVAVSANRPVFRSLDSEDVVRVYGVGNNRFEIDTTNRVDIEGVTIDSVDIETWEISS